MKGEAFLEDIAFDDIDEEEEESYYSIATEDNDSYHLDESDMTSEVKDAYSEYVAERAFL